VARQASNGILRRKIQRLGASSLIVTLPKDWARRHGINVGDILTLYDEGDKLIIAPEGNKLELKLGFSLNHTSVERHAGRIMLCSYVFGFDTVTFKSSKPIKQEFVSRLEQIAEKLPNTRVIRVNERRVDVDLGEKQGDLAQTLVSYGRSISRLLSRLSGFLNGRIQLNREDLDREYESLERLNYELLRIANSKKSIDHMNERQCRYLVSASNLIGLVADAVYKLGVDLLTMINYLSEDEKQRLSFILQVLEVAITTVVLSLEPPSIKKAEESYWKVKSILDLEGQLDEVIKNSSAAFAYLLAKAIDIARIIEISEYIMLCHALISKFRIDPDEDEWAIQ